MQRETMHIDRPAKINFDFKLLVFGVVFMLNSFLPEYKFIDQDGSFLNA